MRLSVILRYAAYGLVAAVTLEQLGYHLGRLLYGPIR
jgi:hypothetical protein